ncbi:MAG: hypothetical protein LBN10_08570 [Propionibacteriaceae bacterium]|jgi:hypothetical protein|nr:hypothetical protein [Propionibacteriaceae bacterium]
MRKIAQFAVALVVPLLGLTGCVASEPEAPVTDARIAGSLQELFQMALDTLNPSEVERVALENAIVSGRIDPADYEAAHVRYVQCMVQQGYQPSFRKTGEGVYIMLPFFLVEDQDALDTADIGCSRDNMAITSLYHIQQSNPDLLSDQRLVAIQCLKKGGYVDVGYTVDNFDRDRGEGGDTTFPFDVYADGPNDCLYGAGYAYFRMGEE